MAPPQESAPLAMVPYQGTRASSSALVPVKDEGKKPRPKFKVGGLDAETLRAYGALMKWEESIDEDFDGVDIGSGPGWKKIRTQYEEQADDFVAKMDVLIGPRNLIQWGGSTIDSVIGAFLTQNACDHSSSNAFMYLGAKFPNEQRNNPKDVPLGHIKERLKLVRDMLNSKENRTLFTKKKKETLESEKMDWRNLKKEAYANSNICTTTKSLDKVDWNAVLHESHDVVAKAIECRGQNLRLALRIQEFLLDMKEKHGSFDLDWLQIISPKNAQIFLRGIFGIGEKSVGCIRLLSLGHRAFLVDVNIRRIAIRLGWIELETSHLDPQEDIFPSGDNYPPLRDVQKYLWPRLCNLQKDKLYKLHCGMITFGKVICTEEDPNCSACPFSAKCKYYKSREKVRPTLPPTALHQIEWGKKRASKVIYDCEPLAKMPPIGDIEDVPAANCQVGKDRRTKKSGNSTSWKPGDGKRMVLVCPQEDLRMLKTIFSLRTEHDAYVLPDEHEVVKQFGKRVDNDHVPYLLVPFPSWKNNGTLKGIVLIPCRTANKGIFPLDGTYFQNNEVIASSSLPVTIRTNSLSDLRRCTVYVGSMIHSIAKGLTSQGIQKCFKEGYICVRGLDPVVGEPTELCDALHATQNKKRDEFDVGKWVWVRLVHHPAPSSKKLPPSFSFYGPYRVAASNLQGMGIYRLTLPGPCPLRGTDFHATQLKPFLGDPPAELPLLPPQQVLASKLVSGLRKLLVQWPGCPYSEATCEDLKEFQSKYPHFKIQDELLADDGIDVKYGVVYKRRRYPRPGKYGLVYSRCPRPDLKYGLVYRRRQLD